MDIEKLIERLRTESLYADKASLEIMDLCMEAATALSTLQIENQALRNSANGFKAENEKLRAELERVKRERDVAQSLLAERIGATGAEPITTAFGLPLDRLRELAQADREGRCVVLPCKIGSPVYMPIGRWNTITGYELDECDGFHIAKDGILQVKVKCCTGNHGTYGVPGKTVFLTREDAEAALRRDQDE